METDTQTELMTKTDVAKFVQCSLRQVEYLVKAGRLPRPFYLGESSPRWIRAKVMEHIEQQASAETAEQGE